MQHPSVRPTTATESIDAEPGPERINALCDGVVSIALTVLALEIKLPEHRDGPLRDALAHQMPTVLAFLLSFVVIGGFWLAHHRLTRRVQRTSRGFNLANIGFMLMVVSLNFPTAALARYGDEDPWAVALYAAVVAGTGLMLLAAMIVAMRQGLFDPAFDGVMQRRALFIVGWPTAVFLSSLALVPFNPLAAMLSWLLAALGSLGRTHWRFGAAPALTASSLPGGGDCPIEAPDVRHPHRL